MCSELDDVGLQSAFPITHPLPISLDPTSVEFSLRRRRPASFDAVRPPVSIVDSPPRQASHLHFSTVPAPPTLFSAEVILHFSSSRLGHSMGNNSGKEKAMKQGPKREVRLKVIPPLDPHLLYWLDRDIQMMQNFTPSNPVPITPPERYQEYMRLHGWMDLDMDDPELAPLFK